MRSFKNIPSSESAKFHFRFAESTDESPGEDSPAEVCQVECLFSISSASLGSLFTKILFCTETLILLISGKKVASRSALALGKAKSETSNMTEYFFIVIFIFDLKKSEDK